MGSQDARVLAEHAGETQPYPPHDLTALTKCVCVCVCMCVCRVCVCCVVCCVVCLCVGVCVCVCVCVFVCFYVCVCCVCVKFDGEASKRMCSYIRVRVRARVHVRVHVRVCVVRVHVRMHVRVHVRVRACKSVGDTACEEEGLSCLTDSAEYNKINNCDALTQVSPFTLESTL